MQQLFQVLDHCLQMHFPCKQRRLSNLHVGPGAETIYSGQRMQ